MEKIDLIFRTTQYGDMLDEPIVIRKEVNLDESLRSVIISTYNEVFEKDGVITNQTPISIAIDKGSDQEKKTDSAWGIPYKINGDDTVKKTGDLEGFYEDWTLREIDEALGAGIVFGDGRSVAISIPSGLGASGVELFDWWGFVADTIGIMSVARFGLRKIAKKIYQIKNKRLQKVFERWAASNINYPSDLREFLDVKPYWRLSEVKLRLGVKYDADAINFLVALGYVPYANEWRMGDTPASKRLRQRWLNNENKYLDRDVCNEA